MRTFLDPADRSAIVGRLRNLHPDAPPRWGSLDAPRMVAHLTDQMRHTLSNRRLKPSRSPLRFPVVKQLALYVIPWPRGRIRGPAGAFVTVPSEWEADLGALAGLVDQFADLPVEREWPGHPFFGSMTKANWGRFCYRHFDHHLTQFGV